MLLKVIEEHVQSRPTGSLSSDPAVITQEDRADNEGLKENNTSACGSEADTLTSVASSRPGSNIPPKVCL